MRTNFLRSAALALVLVAPLATIAKAGDHSGNQWRDDDDNRRVATVYEHANPALVQMELDVYRADTGKSQTAIVPQPSTDRF